MFWKIGHSENYIMGEIYITSRSIHLIFLCNVTFKMKGNILFANIGEFGDKHKQNTTKFPQTVKYILKTPYIAVKHIVKQYVWLIIKNSFKFYQYLITI